MSDTATIPLWDAIGAVIDTGASPPSFLGSPKFYRGAVKGTPAPGYFLLGLTTLAPGGSYNQETGEDGTVTVHCWADTPDNAERLARWLRALLQDQPLVVAGFGTVTGTVSKVGPVSDAAGTAFQSTLIYRVEPEDG